MDPAFEEERVHLADVENKLAAKIKESEATYDRLKSDVDNFVILDYNDTDEYRYLRSRLSSYLGPLENYRTISQDPYFARMDMAMYEKVDNGKEEFVDSEIYYIGRHGLHEGNITIYDWRSEIAQFFNMKREKEFLFEGNHYELKLRRAIHIQNRKLLSVNTEYDYIDSLTFKGDISDPFLLDVLRDKRRAYKLQDIIETINENQNTIIHLPAKVSFAVQGCAGSGKTMVMLHRLSYTLFNNRSISASGIRIITPSGDFNSFIDDLGRSLDIGEVSKSTIEDYYIELIGRYGNSRLTGRFLSESGIKAAFLREIYSLGFRDHFIESYNAAWDDIIAEIGTLGYAASVREFSELLKRTGRACRSYGDVLQKMIGEAEEAEAELSREKERYTAFQKAFDESNSAERELQPRVEEAKADADAALNVRLSEISNGLASIDERKADLEKEIEALKDSEKLFKDDIESRKAELAHMKASEALFSDPQTLPQRSGEPAETIFSACETEFAAIREAELALKKVPFYNFVRRRRVEGELAAAQRAFSEKASALFNAYITQETETVERMDSDNALPGSLKARIEELETLETNAKALLSERNVLNLAQNSYDPDSFKNVKSDLGGPAFAVCKKAVRKYAELRDERASLLASCRHLALNLKECGDRIARLEGRYVSPEIKAQWRQAQALVKQLSFDSLYESFYLAELSALGSKHKEQERKSLYRYKLYLLLLFELLYEGQPNRREIMLNVDEAQDIAPSEYRLLRDVLGGGCAFNLYGDVNQLIYPYREDFDWSDIRDIVGDEPYVLNENYRNTLQITDFCNETFGSDVRAIGLNGAAVKRAASAMEAVSTVVALQHHDAEMRVAVIYAARAATSCVAVLENFDRDIFAVGSLEAGRIAVLNVMEAKGLEFDAVAVLPEKMGQSELYIAYTRAMDNLILADGSHRQKK